MKKCMFLRGNCDHWNTICNMGNAGMFAVPRQQVLAFADICQANMMYILNKSFYLQASWAQNTLYKAIGSFLDPVTKQKINLTSELTHPDLLALYHPCQLESRFGGEAETPTNFWPPFVGDKFIPEQFE